MVSLMTKNLFFFKTFYILPKTSIFPDVYAPFDLDELDEAEWAAEFRFRKRHVRALAEALRVVSTVYAFSVSSSRTLT